MYLIKNDYKASMKPKNQDLESCFFPTQSNKEENLLVSLYPTNGETELLEKVFIGYSPEQAKRNMLNWARQLGKDRKKIISIQKIERQKNDFPNLEKELYVWTVKFHSFVKRKHFRSNLEHKLCAGVNDWYFTTHKEKKILTKYHSYKKDYRPNGTSNPEAIFHTVVYYVQE